MEAISIFLFSHLKPVQDDLWTSLDQRDLYDSRLFINYESYTWGIMGSIPLYIVRKMAKSHYKDHPWLEILANAFLHQKIKLDPILDEDFSIFHKKRLFRSYFESHFWNELSDTVMSRDPCATTSRSMVHGSLAMCSFWSRIESNNHFESELRFLFMKIFKI